MAGAAIDTPKLSTKASSTHWINRLEVRQVRRSEVSVCMKRGFYTSRYHPHPMRIHHCSSNEFSRTRQLVLALLLVAFGWLQFAGIAHKYAHQQAPSHQAAHVLDSGTLQKIFPHHSEQNKTDCQVLDAHCFGLALFKTIPDQPESSVQQELVVRPASPEAGARARLTPEARAPPTLI